MILEVKVYYKTDAPLIDIAFERNLGYFLAQYNLKNYGSGYDLENEVRDIAFDLKGGD